MRPILVLLAALTLSAVETAPANPVAQVLQPLTIAEAANWDCYIEVVPLRPGVVVDTKQAKATTLIVQSWQVIKISDQLYAMITYLRPR
jgi:hypothetical protein